MSASSQTLLKTSLLSTIARFTGVGLNFAVALLLTRTLPTAEAGIILLLMTLVTGLALFSRLGAEQWLIRDVARLDDIDQQQRGLHLQAAYRMVLLSSVAFVVLWLLATPLLRYWLFDDAIQHHALLFAGLGIVFFNAIMLNASFMKAIRQTSTSVLLQNTLPAIAFMVLIALFWPVFTQQQNYVWLYTLSLLGAGLVSFYWLRPWLKQLYQEKLPKQLSIKQVLQQSLPLAPVSYFAFLMLWADTLFVALLLPNEDVALFNVAARLSFVSLFFLGALDATIYPRLLKVHKHQPTQLTAFFWKATLLVAALLGSVTLLLILVGDWMLYAFKPVYVQAGTALSVLLLAQLIRALSLTFSFMFIIQAQVRYLNLLLGSALVINIAANLWLIPQYGIEGAAFATLLANLVLTGSVIVLFWRKRLLNADNKL